MKTSELFEMPRHRYEDDDIKVGAWSKAPSDHKAAFLQWRQDYINWLISQIKTPNHAEVIAHFDISDANMYGAVKEKPLTKPYSTYQETERMGGEEFVDTVGFKTKFAIKFTMNTGEILYLLATASWLFHPDNDSDDVVKPDLKAYYKRGYMDGLLLVGKIDSKRQELFTTHLHSERVYEVGGMKTNDGRTKKVNLEKDYQQLRMQLKRA